MSEFVYDVTYFIRQENELGKVAYLDCDTYLQAARFFKFVQDEFNKKITDKTEWFIELAEIHVDKHDENGHPIQTFIRVRKKEGNI